MMMLPSLLPLLLVIICLVGIIRVDGFYQGNENILQITDGNFERLVKKSPVDPPFYTTVNFLEAHPGGILLSWLWIL